ncbi:MAG: hypothetical protein CR993_03565 [Rhodobacterales bacterium]|nr:MAG: hypothetical protein CR993_03565 [Rhodobacterales bacterium]
MQTSPDSKKAAQFRAFAEALSERIAALPGVERVVRDEADEGALLIWRKGVAEPKRAELFGAFEDFAAEDALGAQGERVIAAWAEALAGSDAAPAAPELQAETLIPMLRNVAYLGEEAPQALECFAAGEALPDGHDGIVALPFAGDLICVLSHIGASGVLAVEEADLFGADLVAEDAWLLAQEHLSAPRRIRVEPFGDEGLFCAAMEEDKWLSHSLVLEPAFLEHFLEEAGIDGALIAFPQGVGLLLAPVDLPNGAALLGRALVEISGRREPLSRLIYRFLPGDQVPEPVGWADAGAKTRVLH